MRRQNDAGRICVISRRGDQIAGQIWLEVDHLDGTFSLFVPSAGAARDGESAGLIFESRFERVAAEKIVERIAREVDFDPDLWVISLDLRSGTPEIEMAKSA